MMESAWVAWIHATGVFNTVHAASLISMLFLYICSLWLTHLVTPSEIEYPYQPLNSGACLRLFVKDQAMLWGDTQASISLAVTTLFWGLGGVIQLLILQWAQLKLQVSVDQAAYLQASTGMGVILGAWLAGRFIPLHQANRVLFIGVVLGAALPILNWIESTDSAWVAMVAVGLLGGLFVVPMNAMLQHRGVQLLTAGRSIAVQNFNENTSVFIQVGCYSILLYCQLELDTIILIFSTVTALAMLSVSLYHWRVCKSANRHFLSSADQ
jgi:LPLT family lysophospholipid transporter-like MFS transporter